jgi:hypothetical protein
MAQEAEFTAPEPEAAAVEKAEEKPQAEEEIETSNTTESAEETIPSEKKEEA